MHVCPGVERMRRAALALLLACEATPAPAPRPASVTALAQAEHRRKGDAAAIHLLARGENAFLGKLEMAPGGEVPEHRDPTEEYIHILEGGGVFTIDGRTHRLALDTTALGDVANWMDRQRIRWERMFDVVDEYLEEQKEQT